jgi:hypothetical protein
LRRNFKTSLLQTFQNVFKLVNVLWLTERCQIFVAVPTKFVEQHSSIGASLNSTHNCLSLCLSVLLLL